MANNPDAAGRPLDLAGKKEARYRYEPEAMAIVNAIKRDLVPDMDSNDGGEILSWILDLCVKIQGDLAASRPGEPWQPISSAPKDGRDILAWDGYNQMVTAWIVFSEGRAEWNSHAMCAEDPILWMPLPDPPKDADQ